MIKPINFNNVSSKKLLSYSEKTAFVFKVTGSHSDFNNLTFKEIKGDIFHNNLIFVDSSLPNLFSVLLKICHFSEHVFLKRVVEELIELNPFNFDKGFDKLYYPYKIKILIDHLARGMNEVDVWSDNKSIYECYPVMKVEKELYYYGENVDRF